MGQAMGCREYSALFISSSRSNGSYRRGPFIDKNDHGRNAHTAYFHQAAGCSSTPLRCPPQDNAVHRRKCDTYLPQIFVPAYQQVYRVTLVFKVITLVAPSTSWRSIPKSSVACFFILLLLRPRPFVWRREQQEFSRQRGLTGIGMDMIAKFCVADLVTVLHNRCKGNTCAATGAASSYAGKPGKPQLMTRIGPQTHKNAARPI